MSCGKAVECRTYVVGECEMHKEERNVLEGQMRKIDECDMRHGKGWYTIDRLSRENDCYPRRWMVATKGEARRGQHK